MKKTARTYTAFAPKQRVYVYELNDCVGRIFHIQLSSIFFFFSFYSFAYLILLFRILFHSKLFQIKKILFIFSLKSRSLGDKKNAEKYKNGVKWSASFVSRSYALFLYSSSRHIENFIWRTEWTEKK